MEEAEQDMIIWERHDLVGLRRVLGVVLGGVEGVLHCGNEKQICGNFTHSFWKEVVTSELFSGMKEECS